jgi:hypothetical protein
VEQIIVLSGRSNIGKSNTIKIVYERLLTKYPYPSLIILPDTLAETGKEIWVVIKINGKRIGIESRGDNRTLVENALSIFVDYKCDIILCASRTRGESWDAIQAFGSAHDYNINRIEKVSKPTQPQQDISNIEYAEDIIERIENFF